MTEISGQTSSTLDLEDEYEIPIYPKRGITIVRGQGSLLYDENDKRYIDCIGGIGVANIGHAHPELVQTLESQASQLITCPEILSNPIRAKLLQRLVELTPATLDRVYLCNSGTEATEAAIKFARISTGKSKIITAMRGFHGRTYGSLSATFNRKYREPFAPLVPDFEFVPFDKIPPLEEKIDTDTAAIMLEVIQGNGGVHIADQDYLTRVRQLCDEHNILLILDEVQTGIGRTGRLFAFEHYGIVPDILTSAKAIAGGVPMGAVIVNSSKISISKSLHGSTFGGNPLACAAALKTLDIIETENLIEKSDEMGKYFSDQLSNIDSSLIREIRHKGLMIGLELRIRIYSVLEEMQNHGILANPAGSTVIRFLPPLVISQAEIDEVVSVVSEVLANHEQ